MRVRAKSKYDYSDHRREYQAGDEFDMDDRQSGEVDILCTLGKLERVKGGEAQKTAPRHETKVMQPEEAKPAGPVAPLTTEDSAPLTPRHYRRRDMRPQE